MIGFEDKTVFITGASRGIGRAIAEQFVLNGAKVLASAKTDNHDMHQIGISECISVDFSDRSGIERCAQFVRDREPDIIVNNAAINSPSKFEQIDHDEFLRMQQVNVFAPMVLCQSAIPSMKGRGWGRIVNISSVFSKVGKDSRSPYSASKFALDGLTISLAIEYASSGILANCVSPGFVDTEMTRRVLGDDGIRDVLRSVPIGRLAKPNEVAKLVLWLASGENTFVTAQNIAIDGGFTRA